MKSGIDLCTRPMTGQTLCLKDIHARSGLEGHLGEAPRTAQYCHKWEKQAPKTLLRRDLSISTKRVQIASVVYWAVLWANGDIAVLCSPM